MKRSLYSVFSIALIVTAITILFSIRALACPMKGMMGEKMDSCEMMKGMKEHHQKVAALINELEEHEKILESTAERDALISEIKRHLRLQDSILKEMVSHCAKMHSMMEMECGGSEGEHKGHH